MAMEDSSIVVPVLKYAQGGANTAGPASPVNLTNESCQACNRGGIVNNPHLKLLHCIGPAPMSAPEGDGDEQASNIKTNNDVEVEPCGALYHPACLPPNAEQDGLNDEG